jgi:hypothetical protein
MAAGFRLIIGKITQKAALVDQEFLESCIAEGHGQ